MKLPLPDLNDDGGYSFTAGMSVDADGSPHAYNQPPEKGLDYIENAGHRGNWWGLACNSHGDPYVQGAQGPQAGVLYDDSCAGYYVSTTSYQRGEFPKNDPRRYLNSETEYFFVLPAHWRALVPGVVLGCKGSIRDSVTGNEVFGVIGDFGPGGHKGEASIAYAEAFGLDSNPKTGGTEHERFTYTFWPDVVAEGYELQPA